MSDGMSPEVREFAGKKVLAGILGIVLGSFGVHKFVLGFITPGIIMVIASIFLFVFTCGMGNILTWAIGLAEGIIYLTKSDEEFYQLYKVQKKQWF